MAQNNNRCNQYTMAHIFVSPYACTCRHTHTRTCRPLVENSHGKQLSVRRSSAMRRTDSTHRWNEFTSTNVLVRSPTSRMFPLYTHLACTLHFSRVVQIRSLWHSKANLCGCMIVNFCRVERTSGFMRDCPVVDDLQTAWSIRMRLAQVGSLNPGCLLEREPIWSVN